MTLPDAYLLSEPFLWAYRFCDGARQPLERVVDLPPGLVDGTGWTWAHFSLADQRARAYIEQLSDMPAEARNLLLGDDCAPRIAFDGAWAFGALPDFHVAFDGGNEGPGGRLRFAFDGRRLVTARRHALQTVQDVRRRIQADGLAFPAPIDGLCALLRRYSELASDHLDDLSVDLDGIEDRVLDGTGDLSDVQLGPLRRELSRRHRELAALRTAMHRAVTRQPPLANAASGATGNAAPPAPAHPLIARLPALMQLADDADHEVSSLQDRARLVHEELDTRLTGVANRTLQALTIMSALLMPPTLIVGAFGMNLKGITFGEDPEGFAIVCLLCLFASAAVYVGLRIARMVK